MGFKAGVYRVAIVRVGVGEPIARSLPCACVIGCA